MQQEPAGNVRLSATVSGRVQGVGFRYWARERAERLGLVGSAVNQADGTVGVVAEGPRDAVRKFAAAFESGTAPGRVDAVEVTYGPPVGGFTSFEVG